MSAPKENGGQPQPQAQSTSATQPTCPYAYPKFLKCPIKSNQDDPANTKLDNSGCPLVPQPNEFKDDPLNWPGVCKLCMALQISLIAFVGPMGAATINPALVQLADAFGGSTLGASYLFAIFLLLCALGAFIALPLSNVYGRRPILLLGNALGGTMNVVAGYTGSWAVILVTRALGGLGVGATIAVGTASLEDMYWEHQQGFYKKMHSLFLSNGIFFGHFIGGFIAEHLGWRRCFSVPGYIQLIIFGCTLVTLPESIYSRMERPQGYTPKEYWDLLLLCPLKDAQLHAKDFMKPFDMARYPSITLPAVYCATAFAFGSILFAVTGAQLFHETYNFDLVQTGLVMSIPLLIGSILGELGAGWCGDMLVDRKATQAHGVRYPEVRLDLLWIALLVPIGIITQGVSLTDFKTVSWVGAAFGMGLASFGMQVALTVVKDYTIDCYGANHSETSNLMYIIRQVFAGTVAFYALPLGRKINIEYAWLVLAIINIAFLLPVFALRRYGSKWRGEPPKPNYGGD